MSFARKKGKPERVAESNRSAEEWSEALEAIAEEHLRCNCYLIDLQHTKTPLEPKLGMIDLLSPQAVTYSYAEKLS